MKTISSPKGKSLFAVLCLSFFLALMVCQFPVSQAAAAPAEGTPPELLEAAKKEGKLLLYSAAALEVGLEILKKFRDKYPFIQTDLYRTGAQAMLTKVLAEAQSKKYSCDVVMVPGGESMALMKKGLFAKYHSPQSKFYPEGFKDPEGSWTDVYLTLNGLVYNTKLTSPQEIPTSWQDLLHPKWKGKIGIDTKSFEWFAYMLKIMGQKNGLQYMEKLSTQNLKFYADRPMMAQLVAAGELSLALVYTADVELRKDKGAPLEWIAIEPMIPSIHPIAIFTHAPHPNAAKLFVDFSLSQEGQESWVRVYRVPSRPDVKPLRMTKVPKILTPDFAIIGDYEKNLKLFREVLMKK